MAPKDRADQIEQRSPLRLPNKIADASPTIANNLLHRVKADIECYRHNDSLPRFFLQMASLTAVLPPHWESFPPDMKLFLEKEMFDPIITHVLESEGLMNWCSAVKKVYPLITPGDGNCLLHAVSLAMWAMEDTHLVLRTGLYRLLLEDINEKNRLRWQRERSRVDAGIPGSGLVYDSMEWQSEWEMVKMLASPETRPATAQGLMFESLEQYHIFMLANMLRRPIIVVAQDMMRSHLGHSLQPQNLHGIYLPLNWDPSVCYHYPILLGFHQNHFAPLVCTAALGSEEDSYDYLFPIVLQDLTKMAVHFLDGDEEKQVDSLLRKYLIVEEIIHMGQSLNNTNSILGVRLVSANNQPELDLMIPYLDMAETHYRAYLEMEYGNGSESLLAAVTGAAFGQSKDNTQPAQEQSKSLPSVSGNMLHQPVKTSWSGSGAPVSQPQDETATAGSSASKNPPLNREFSLVNQSCKTDGCIYYRSVTTGEYCHECFQKQNQSVKCLGEGCLNPSVRDCQGLCQVCFDQRKIMETPATEATAPPLSNMSVNHVAYKAAAPLPAQNGTRANICKPEDTLVTAVSLQMPPDRGTASSGDKVGEASSPRDELSSFIVDQKLPTKKCIIPECLLTGDPAMNDMCGKCYAENLQAVQEMKKSQKAHQPPPAALETSSRYAPTLSASAASGSGAIPKATAGRIPQYAVAATAAAPVASNDPLYGHNKPTSRFTVQKNICANAGCDGVRLVGPSFLGYCFNCFNRNQRNPQQGFVAQGDPRVPQSDKTQYAAPGSKPAVQSGAVPYFMLGEGQQREMQNPRGSSANPATIGKSTAIQSVPAPETNMKKCMHPRCDNPAAPPKFALCNQCIGIMQEAMGSEEGTEMLGHQAVSGNKQQPEKTEPASHPKEAAKPTSQSGENVTVKAKSVVVNQTGSASKAVVINRIKCQIPGGCSDDMYGDPELDNLCSRCFAKMSLRRTRTRASPPTCLAEPQPPARAPAHHYRTAPITPSPRMLPAKASSFTDVIFVSRDVPRVAAMERYKLPANYQPCARPGCNKQANMQILEGFCNDCHEVYRQQAYPLEVSQLEVKPQMANRGRFAQSSQSTIPEAWVGPANRSNDQKILNVAVGSGQPPRAEPNRTDMRCLSNDCANYGNPRCQGYCNSCFRLLKH